MRTWTRVAALLVAAGCGKVGEWQPVEVDGGLLYVTSTLDDGTELRCFVDTGSNATFIHTDVPLGDEPPFFLVGDQELELYALSHPDMDPVLESLSGGVDCLIGWDSLEPTPFTIDYAGARMRLSDRGVRTKDLDGIDPDDAIVIPMVTTRPGPMIEARVHDVPAILMVDTGAQAAVLTPELLDRLENPPDTESVQVNSVDGLVDARFGLLRSLTVGGATYEDVEFVSYDSLQIDAAVEEGHQLDGLVGASTLLRHLVTFDDGRGEIILHPYSEDVQDELLETYRESFERAR